MNSTSDCSSENAVDKVSLRTYNASTSNDSVVHSKSEGMRFPEGHDDCLSCGSGTDEHAHRKSDSEDGRTKYKKHRKISGEGSDKVPPSSMQSGLHPQNLSLEDVPSSKSPDATDMCKVQNTFSQASNGKCLSDDRNQRDVKDDKLSDTKDDPLEGSGEHLDSLPNRGGVSDCHGDPSETVLSSIKKKDDMEVEIHHIDETDNSDLVEHDVKICDICGDAGQEDLLAICCQCSDGAEHTYCMREMLAKVPEGEWLCEECKTIERVGNARQQKIGRMGENEKNNSPGQASSEHVNTSDVEGHKTKDYMKISCKSHTDDVDTEVSSVAKKPALESIVGAPKISKSNNISACSREGSLKNIGTGKLQSLHPSSGTVPVNDPTELASSALDLRVPNFQGTLSKSSSFSSLNIKPNVKPVDQVVRRQKSAREYGSPCLREGIVRSVGKSLSFKSTNSNRSESKIKMISPRMLHVQDIKSTKQRTSIERQHSFRKENSSINSTKGTMNSTSRIDKRPASQGESSFASVSNHLEKKPVQTEGKSAALSRSSSIAARRTSDLSGSSGEFKRSSLIVSSTPGVSSSSGVNNFEQKSSETSLKEELSGSVVAEKLPFNANEGLPNGLTRPREVANSGEQMREYSGSCFDQPSVKSPRDESDNLKAAIEAAVRRKPGVYRKNRAFSQSDDSSVSSMVCEGASQQKHASSAGNKKLPSDAELPERTTISQSMIADSLTKETHNSVKQSLILVEGLDSGGQDGDCIGPSSRDVFRNVSAARPLLLKSLAIPDQEYIWQGSFEIYRSGKLFASWNGIQAHLSTCASPKVVDAVNKFKSRVVLYEVPRLSIWPIQFQEHGVREDNIALFFFAKDLESYDKTYKILLDNMMKNDLALKGNANGVELLIFPSNQLPDNSQQWNMLFFLWGVFRGKKESCLQHMPESSKHCYTPRDIPSPILTLPENKCSQKPIAEDLFARDDTTLVIEAPALEALRSSLSSRAVNVDTVTKASFLDVGDNGMDSGFLAAVQNDAAKQCQEMKGPCQEERTNSSSCPSIAMRNPSCSGREQMPMQLDTQLDGLQSTHHSSISMASVLKDNIGEGIILDSTCNQNQVKKRIDAGDPSMDGETPLEDSWGTRDLNMEPDGWPFNSKERMYPGACVTPQILYAGTRQGSVRRDDTSNEPCGALEKTNHVPSASNAQQNGHHEDCVETLIPKCNENAERRFFPTESQPVKGMHLDDRTTPWKMHLLEQDKLNDRAPNLELALGTEKTLLSQGMQSLVNRIDQKINEEHILEESGTNTEEDESASLSLSLSFPFPKKEPSTRSAPKTEQLVSEREHMNTSMLLFGKLGEN